VTNNDLLFLALSFVWVAAAFLLSTLL